VEESAKVQVSDAAEWLDKGAVNNATHFFARA
jgi:hypothetical protein